MLHRNGKISLHVIVFYRFTILCSWTVSTKVTKTHRIIKNQMQSQKQKITLAARAVLCTCLAGHEHVRAAGHALPVPGRGHFSQCGPQALPTLQQQSCLVR